jgi:hypothetical protein
MLHRSRIPNRPRPSRPRRRWCRCRNRRLSLWLQQRPATRHSPSPILRCATNSTAPRLPTLWHHRQPALIRRRCGSPITSGLWPKKLARTITSHRSLAKEDTMLLAIKLSNRIGYAFNIWGFKFSVIVGYREWYRTESGQLCYHNHWLARTPKGWMREATCQLSTLCTVPHEVIRKYKYKYWQERKTPLQSLLIALRLR